MILWQYNKALCTLPAYFHCLKPFIWLILLPWVATNQHPNSFHCSQDVSKRRLAVSHDWPPIVTGTLLRPSEAALGCQVGTMVQWNNGNTMKLPQYKHPTNSSPPPWRSPPKNKFIGMSNSPELPIVFPNTSNIGGQRNYPQPNIQDGSSVFL